MSNFNEYSDEELGRMIRAALESERANLRSNVTSKQALQSFLRMAGLGFISDAMDLVQYTYERIRNILSSMFNTSEKPSQITTTYDTVGFSNDCTEDIFILIRTKNLNNRWETNGWFKLSQGETRYISETRNRYIYYYAEGGSVVWRGEYSFTFEGNVYGFKELLINDDSWGNQLFSLSR